ncbi:hypothetical protein [Brevundimonas diminuta]|jgi:hypothetical protein|uniref:hypothetical protein n=1 Tax=Brevundimonas diminuta TaxID=293 RepID=UPI0028AAFEA8|nr:hypothetical protein [Brevundimonas diminuta]
MTQTDAEKLAAAEAAMAAAAEAAKAARLPSANAAVSLLSGEQSVAFLSGLKAAIADSVDDLPRPLGAQGAEGTKQMLQRIVTSMESGLSAAQARVQSLQPTPAPEALAEPEA